MAGKIRYATGIEYFGGSLTLPGAAYREPWRDSSDNPMSPAFIPVETRPEQSRARWWALHKRRNQSPAAGVFD